MQQEKKWQLVKFKNLEDMLYFQNKKERLEKYRMLFNK